MVWSIHGVGGSGYRHHRWVLPGLEGTEMTHWLRRRWWVVPVTLLIIMLVPFSVNAAATDSQVILVLGKVIEGVVDGVIKAGRDAYCAVGVTALCP